MPRNECKSSVLEAYWPDFHKPIYITFKLLDTLKFFIFIKDKTSCGIVIWEKWEKMAKYGKDEKRSTKICKLSFTI